MLVYDAISPAPRCLRMFILEKRMAIDSVTIDVFKGERGENREAAYLAKNPAGQTPALELDDGTVISEAVAISEYLEELHPEPTLIGTAAAERAETRMWWRRVELNITEFAHNAFHYGAGLERFKPRIPVAPEAADGLWRIYHNRLRWLDAMFTGPYLCGPRFSAADIWAYVWLDFANANKQAFDPTLKNIGPWFNRCAARPSAQASRSVLNASAHP